MIYSILYNIKQYYKGWEELKIRSNIYSILKFSASSLSSFLLDYLLFSALIYFLPDTAVMILTANISARVISAIYNYCINCKFVFKENKKIRSAASYFLLAVFILTMNNLLLSFFTSVFSLSPYIAKLITECTLFIISWLIQKKIIFKNK